MPLYISNPSKQDVTFPYRLGRIEPREKGPMIAYIPSGGQIVLGQTWSPEQREYVIEQLETHGARDAAESHAAMHRFNGLIYRDDGIISEDEIMMAHDQIVDTQERRSATEAMRAVAAFDRNANARGKGRRLTRVTEMTIKQELGPKDSPTGKEIDFTMSIDPEGRNDVKTPL